MKKIENDLESNYSDEYLSNLIEIGQPKILKGHRESKKSFQNLSVRDITEKKSFNSQFFCKEIKDYISGGFLCEFCKNKTLSWQSNKSDLHKVC